MIRIRELCGVRKGLDERIEKGVLKWFGYVERVERDKITKRVYLGECAGSRSVGRQRKRWNDTASGKQGEWCRIRVNTGGL